VTIQHPGSAEELAHCLGEADREGLAVLPRGGGRAFGMGDVPERSDLIIETGGLNRLVERSQHDLTVTVEAGMTLEALSTVLAETGQFLPLDPYNGPGHTVGGALASGWTGPLRQGYGTPRDFLIGLRFVLPDGRRVHSGGRVVKNVSGYDLKKLHLGALGSLGIIVEASFKVFPRPAAESTLRRNASSLEAAWAEAGRALASPQPPVALEASASSAGIELVARLAGWPRAIERMESELGWEKVSNDYWDTLSQANSPSWARISVPPAALMETAAHLPREGWSASVGVGSIQWFGASQPEQVREVRARAEAAGGHLVLLAAPDGLKAAVGAWGQPSPSAALMARVREAYDPRRTMAPGRFVI